MKPIDITGTVRDTFSIGIGKNKSEFGVFYGSLYFRNFEDNSWKKAASIQDISSSTKDFSWKSNTLYNVNSLIEYQGVFYKCTEEHVSGQSTFLVDLAEVSPKWQEIGFYGNLKLINLSKRSIDDFYYKISQYDDNIVIFNQNPNINSTFKLFLPEKRKINLGKTFNIQNASFNKVEIYYYNNTIFSNSAFGDYVVKIQLIDKDSKDNNIGGWSTIFSNSRPMAQIGEWKSSENYRVNDVVRNGYFVYTCIAHHTSNSNQINGFNIDYEKNKWIYSGGSYAGGTYGLVDRMPINLRNTGSREVYQVDMLNIPYKGNIPDSVQDLKNRRMLSNDSPENTPRFNASNMAELLSNFILDQSFKNKSTGEILRYIYQNYKSYEGNGYSSSIKLTNGVPGKKYILLIKSDGGPYLFDSNIVFPSYGNPNNLAQIGTTEDTSNWFLNINDSKAQKIISNGLNLTNSSYPVQGYDDKLIKENYKGNIFPSQSDPGKIDAFEFICLDYYSDQNIRPGSKDLFIARYIGSYNMGDNFPLRLTPFMPIIGGPGQDEGDDVQETYIPPIIDYVTLNSQSELNLVVGQTLINLTIITNLIKGSKGLTSLKISHEGLVMGNLIPNPLGGEEIFNTITPFNLNVPGKISIKILAGDDKTFVLKEANINFIHKIYWGFSKQESISDLDVIKLQHQEIRNSLHNQVFSFLNNPNYEESEYIYFCYPSQYNDIAFVEDAITGFNYNNDSFEIKTMEITNEYSIKSFYKIYRTKIKTFGGNFKWKINLL